MNLRNLFSLMLVIFLTIGGILVVWPENPKDLFGDRFALPSGQGVSIFGFEREGMRLGLDLQGGTRLLLLAEPPDDFDGNLDDALEGTLRILRKRVDATGIAEAEITQQGVNNISIQF